VIGCQKTNIQLSFCLNLTLGALVYINFEKVFVNVKRGRVYNYSTKECTFFGTNDDLHIGMVSRLFLNRKKSCHIINALIDRFLFIN
jgi:hypothetical protein